MHNTLSNSSAYKHGLTAELIATLLLSVKFYSVIHRRYKTKVGEVDLIARRGKTIIFVEVKKRRSRQEVFEAITISQKRRISRAAEHFLSRNKKFNNYNKRFDAVLITPKSLPLHIKNAWEC